MLYLWFSALVLFVVVEACTTQMICVWFAIGSLCAALSNFLGAPEWLQVVVFAVVSAAALALTRPLVKKLRAKRTSATNADRNIGQTALCIETIDNNAGTGAVRLLGKDWTARTASGEVIKKDTLVEVQEISGVKLIVKPASDTADIDIVDARR